MRTKILYVITKANWGGAQRYVFDLATHLPKEAFDVHVAYGREGRLATELKKAGITCHHIPSLQRDVAFGADARSFSTLYALFKNVRPHVVHLNSSKVGGLGSLAARLAGVKRIIFTAHGWPFWEKRSAPVRALIWLISWCTALLSHTVIVISNYDLAVARKMPFVSKKIVRIYNGIDLHTQFGSGDKIRAAFPTGAHITGTVGELTTNKNQIALIEAAKDNTDMYVAIVGEGELRARLEEKIKEHKLEERVKLFGFIPAVDAMKGFDTFVLPSIKEGLPYVLLEAKAAGVPIVANRVGGVGEVLDTALTAFSLERMVEETIALYVK